MKKSHRKDVIVARIVFAVFCLLLILAIAGAVLLIRGHLNDKKNAGESQSQSQETETQGESVHGENAGAATPDVTPEPSQEPEPKPIMRTTTAVNMREEPNTDCEVITVLEEGTMLEMLGEEAGWAFVDVSGQTGYVSLDYLEEVTAEQ